MVTIFVRPRKKLTIFVRPKKKLKILNLARKGKMIIFSEWDKLKPVIFLDLR